ncbi:MAG TPA: cytochrome c3 family protein [Candidatus Dormibacteraeota bacterium]|nr:cytochrome c3 family protein [Candidatus Dormibacteraeota bacterium]
MSARRKLLTLTAFGFIAAVLLISCSSLERTVLAPPEIAGASYVGNKACYECHTNITRMFSASAHARVHLEDAKLVGQTGCESCHGPGSKHIEAGGGRGKFIVNPGKEPSVCFQCHLQTQAEFNLPQHHPVVEGRMNCLQCHDPHGSDIFKPSGGGLAMARRNESCGTCHREQTRPFVFEHEALREGCTTCHNPHGSINRKLLVEPDANLCLKCHAQVQHQAAGEIYIGNVSHTALLRQGTCWSSGCHTAVHGSNVHPRMFY